MADIFLSYASEDRERARNKEKALDSEDSRTPMR